MPPAAVFGAVMAALVAVVVGCVAFSGKSSSASANTSTVPASTPTRLPRAEKCVELVMNALEQVPQALNDGYDAGVNMKPIFYEFGMNSPESKTASATNGWLIANIMVHGHPERQVAMMRSNVEQGCRGE